MEVTGSFGRAKGASPAGRLLFVAVLLILVVPAWTGPADAILSGQNNKITLFSLGPNGPRVPSYSAMLLNNNTNQILPSQLGFHFPASAIGVSGSFDLTSEHAYKPLSQELAGTSDWTKPGANQTNTTTTFGLRLDLDRNSPFYPPNTNDLDDVFNTTGNAAAIAAGDFNSDGLDDVALFDGGSVVFKFNGPNGFISGTSFTYVGSPLKVRAADLNVDGRMDVIVSTTSGSTSFVQPILQTAGGTLRSEGTTVAVGDGGPSAATDMAIGDLTGDGYPDVAFVYSNRTAYWLNSYGGKNLETWSADEFSVATQVGFAATRVNDVRTAPAACGNLVAVGLLDSTVGVYRLPAMTLVASLANNTQQINAVRWAPNCAYLAATSSDRTFSVWETTGWTLLAQPVAHLSSVYGLAISPDSQWLATGGSDGFLKVWSMATPSAPVETFNVTETNGTINTLEFSPDGLWLVEGTRNATVRVRTTSDYSLTNNLNGHTGEVRALAFTPDSLFLVSGSDDDRAIVWNISSMSQETSLTQATNDLLRLNINPQGTRLITAGADGRARTYRTSNWTVVETVTVGTGTNRIFGVDFDQNGTGFLAGTESDNQLRRYDKLTLINPARVQTRQEFSVRGVAYGPGTALASGSDDGTIAITDTSTGTVATRFVAHNGSVNALAWSPSGLYLVSVGSDGRIKVWSAANWALLANISQTGNLTAVDISADGSTAAAGNATGGVGVYSTSSWTANVVFYSGGNITGLALNPSGSTLALVGNQANVRLVNAGTGANISNLTGGAGLQRAVDWSPDGTRIASGGNASLVNQWWTSNSTFIPGAVGHNGTITAVSYSPDSSLVASGGSDRRIYTWALNGSRVQGHALPATSNFTITSLAWTRDGRFITSGWNDTRFAARLYSACPSGICPSSDTGSGIAVGDANAASGNDIVIVASAGFGSDGGAYIYNFAGTYAGTWTSAAGSTTAMSDAEVVALGDLDGDGHNDIAVASSTQLNGNLYMLAWNSTSNSWNSPVQSIPIPGEAKEIAIADLTDDGHNDVAVAAGGSANRVVVAFWEQIARPLGPIKIVNISRYDTPVLAGVPTGLALGHFNNDTLWDVATSNGAALSVWIYHQKDTLDGFFISAPFSDPTLPFPIVTARMTWEDFNVVPGVTSYLTSVSINSGFSWIPMVQNQSINFSGSGGASMLYRFDFHSEHAGITAWITKITIFYTLETTMQNPFIDVGNDGVRDWNHSGAFIGTEHVSFAPDVIDRFVQNHIFEQDANGSLFIPVALVFIRPGAVTFSNLTVAFNARTSAPVLKSPGPGSYATANPTFVLSANDTDLDRLWYNVQLSRDVTFAQTLFEYNQLLSVNCWGSIFYLAGTDAQCTSPDPDRLTNGVLYWWRARAWDGQQWSDWSLAQNFTVDDQPPEGAATAPLFSTIEQFTVSWSATDAAGGSGLAAAPYDVQYKVGLQGGWQDWQTHTSNTSAVFTGAAGETYYFRMRAVDFAGNQQQYLTSSAGDTHTTIDLGRPTATLGTLAGFQASRTFSVSWSGLDGVGESGVAAYRVEVQVDGGAWTVWLAEATGNSAAFTASSDSNYCFRAAAIDNAGNIGNTTTPLCTRVDTTPPSCTVTIGYTTTTSLDRIAATILCTESDTALLGYEVGVGMAAGISDVMRPTAYVTPPTTLTNLSLENGGTYFVNVRAQNAAGAFSAWVASTPVAVIVPGPVATVSYPDGVWTSTNVTLLLTTADPLGFNVVAVELQYRRAVFRFNQPGTWEDWRTLIANASDTSHYFDSLVRGYGYEFRYRARNEVGSWGAFSVGAVMYVNQLPIPNAGGDVIVDVNQPVDLDASSSLDYDGVRDNLTFTWESDTGEPGTGPKATFTFSQPGTHTVTLKVFDGHENTTAVLRIYVNEPVVRPILPGFDGAFTALALVGAATAVAALGRRRRQ